MYKNKKLRETTNLSVETINSKRQVKGEFSHVVTNVTILFYFVLLIGFAKRERNKACY